jgi:hypothetical protein
VNVYTETAPFRDVILAAFASVGAIPKLTAVPLGEVCTGSGECVSGLCGAAGSDAGLTCTQDCATASCPGGFRCDHALCVPAPSSGCRVATEGAPSEAGWLAGVAVCAVLSGLARRPSRLRRRVRP